MVCSQTSGSSSANGYSWQENESPPKISGCVFKVSLLTWNWKKSISLGSIKNLIILF